MQALHLTNILEDEEEIQSQPVAKQTPYTKIANVQDLNSNLVQFNSMTNSAISLSRRSSRGGNSSDNAISALTIPEEGETDFSHSLNLHQQKKSKLSEGSTSANLLSE